MRPRFFPILLIAVSVCAVLRVGADLHAQEDLPAGETTEMLNELAKLKEQQQKSSDSAFKTIQRQIEEASSSPSAAIQFYSRVHRDIEITGRSGENGEFREWKERQESVLEDRNVRRAVQFHLAYLALTVRRLSGEEIEKLVPDLVSYVSTVFTADDLMETENEDARMLIDAMLNSPLTESVFVRWFQIGDMLAERTKSEDWEMVPGHADTIVETIVLPELRRKKDQRVFQYWEERIAREQAAAMRSKLDFRIATFEKVTKPELLWNRAKEYAKVGMPNRAVKEMLAVLKKYPSHKDARIWIGEVEAMLQPSVVEAQETPAEILEEFKGADWESNGN